MPNTHLNAQASSDLFADNLSGAARLKCYVFSDIHLNSYWHYHPGAGESARQKNLRLFLARIERGLSSDDELLIILNGDILDINESWQDSPEPWSEDRHSVEQVYLKVLKEILESNSQIVEAVRQLLERPSTKIVYVMGNHDYLLEVFDSGHQLIRDMVFDCLPEELKRNDRITFVSDYQDENLGLYAEHGHKLDPFNSYNFTKFPPLGEIINVAVVNKLHLKVVDRLANVGYSEQEIELIKRRLKEIEYLRPLALFPLWIEKISDELPKIKVKRPPVEQIVRECLLEIVSDRDILGYFTHKVKIPMWLLQFTAKLALNNPVTLPVLSYIVTRFFRQNHSNRAQYKKAIKLHQKTGLGLIAFGHTHRPSAKPIGNAGYYFNTGSWKPVTNYVKGNYGLPFEEEFVKMEHWGVLRIEKPLNDPEAKTEYFLETVKNGYVD